MADPKVRFKRSSVPGKIPNETQVPLGEIALNTYDGKLFASKNVGIGTTVFVVNPWNVGAGTDAYDINFTAGNVGIGSTLPTSKLSVSGDGRFTGVVTATSFSGSGSNLSGIVTYITAGSGILIDQSTGNVTITSTGGAGAGVSALTSADNYIITLTPSFNGITTAFTMQYNGNNYTPLNEQQLLVSLAGVIQEPNVAYTVTSSTLTFASAPNTASDYFITALNTAPISRNAQSYNVTGVQTNFTLDNGYTIGYVDVYLNGARLVSGDDYTANNGTTVGLTSAAQNGDVVEVVGYKAVSLATGDLVINGNLEVTGITTLGGVVQVGVGSTALIVDGDARVTGILTVGTASVTIDGINNKINVGTGLTLSNGIVASGIITASSFVGDGTSLTNLNASNLSSGVVPASRITTTSALSVGGDLYVSGNISFGGTTTQLNTSQLTFSDPDLVLGVGTTSTFNPTDNTANHGGIAIASTEGSPLVNLNIDPAEVLPSTYKKIMWFKNNTSGLGTDAWLSNYAVGIGSTQFPTGTRLAAGNVQFDTNDLKVIRNINSSGVVTATSATVNGGNLLVGSTSATGTSSQPLQVTGGAYVSGNLGIGATNPQNPLHISGSPGTLLRLDGGAGGTGTRDILFTEFNSTLYGGIIRYDSAADLFTFGTVENSVVVNAINVTRTAGNVGVGLTNPGQKLDVSGSIRASSQLISSVSTGTAPLSVTSTTVVTNLNADLLDGYNVGTSGGTIPLLNASNTWSAIQTFGEIRPTADNAIVATGTAASDDVWGGCIEIREINQVGNTQTSSPYAPGITFHWGNVSASAIKMYSDASIRMIAQGSTGSSYRDTYVASLVATGNVTAYSSDRRLKENFNHIENPLEKVQKLNGYTFDWNKKSEELGFTPQYKTNDVGLIAQEVQAVLPQAAVLAPFDRDTNENGETVSKSGENYLTIQYERLVPLLVEAIKEQQEQINTLKEEINNLKK
jgi:hypothetical protein